MAESGRDGGVWSPALRLAWSSSCRAMSADAKERRGTSAGSIPKAVEAVEAVEELEADEAVEAIEAAVNRGLARQLGSTSYL